jgi:hypothetical protein
LFTVSFTRWFLIYHWLVTFIFAAHLWLPFLHFTWDFLHLQPLLIQLLACFLFTFQFMSSFLHWWPTYLPSTCIVLICLRLVICFFTCDFFCALHMLPTSCKNTFHMWPSYLHSCGLLTYLSRKAFFFTFHLRLS